MTDSWPTEAWPDAELALVLTEVGERIRQPAFSLATRVRAEVESPDRLRHVTRSRRAIFVVAAVVLVIVVATAIIAPARDAVARFFGIGTTTVERVETLPDAGSRDPLTAGGSAQRLAAQLHDHGWYEPRAALVGDPTGWDVTGQSTTVAWPSVILAQEMGAPPSVKLIPQSAGTEFVDVGTVSGLWVPGPHVREVAGRRYESKSALVWVDHGIQFRLEGDLAKARMIAIAESLRRA